MNALSLFTGTVRCFLWERGKRRTKSFFLWLVVTITSLLCDFCTEFLFLLQTYDIYSFLFILSIRNMIDSLYPSLNDPPPHTHTHYYFILQHYPIFFSSKHLKPALCDFGRLFLIFFSGKVFRVFPIFVRMLVCLLYTVCKVIYLEKLIDSNTQQKHQIEHLQKELKIFLLWFILQTRNQFFSNSNLGGTQWCSG